MRSFATLTARCEGASLRGLSSFRAKSRNLHLGSFRAKSRNLHLALFLVFTAATARAQDSLPSFERPNGALLRTGVLTYQLSLLKPDGTSLSLGTRTVSVTDSPLGGTPSWLLVEARTGTVVPTLDSVFVSRADLGVERWVANAGQAQLAVSFTRDTAYGVLQNYQGRSSFIVGVPANVLLSAAHGERLIEMLPLAEGYRAAATMLVVGGPTPVLMPAQIVVEREEDVDLNGRRIRAWRVALRTGAIEARYWVSRDGTRVVRTEQALADGVMVGVLQ